MSSRRSLGHEPECQPHHRPEGRGESRFVYRGVVPRTRAYCAGVSLCLLACACCSSRAALRVPDSDCPRSSRRSCRRHTRTPPARCMVSASHRSPSAARRRSGFQRPAGSSSMVDTSRRLSPGGCHRGTSPRHDACDGPPLCFLHGARACARLVQRLAFLSSRSFGAVRWAAPDASTARQLQCSTPRRESGAALRRCRCGGRLCMGSSYCVHCTTVCTWLVCVRL